MKSFLTTAGFVLALSSIAQAAASPAPHMMSHSMKSGSTMSHKSSMKGSMKSDRTKGDHMMGHAMASPSAMHGAMKPSHTP